jgi:predicted DNA-binding transcriptional regulator AlpA
MQKMFSGTSRRVYKPELMRRLGYGETWFRRKQLDGTIPSGYRDPGGKRVWWPQEEVDVSFERLQAQAVPAEVRAIPMPARKAEVAA